jgi:hypothetical protein
MSEQLTPEHFLPHVDKVFRVRSGRHALKLVNVEVRPLQEWEAKIVPRQPFNLIFRGPPGDVLAEGLHTLEVEDGPSFELYVIPIFTTVPGRQDYQAPFN